MGSFLTIPGVLNNGEAGLLSIVFHPNYKNNGRFFVHYSCENCPVTLSSLHCYLFSLSAPCNEDMNCNGGGTCTDGVCQGLFSERIKNSPEQVEIIRWFWQNTKCLPPVLISYIVSFKADQSLQIPMQQILAKL